MKAYSEIEAIFSGCLFPSGQNIFLGSHVDRIPGLVLAVPQVHVVMMVTQGKEILCTYLLVKGHQLVGIPVFSFPQRNDVLESELRGMTVMLYMVFIFIRTFHIHGTRHPVTCTFHALRSPMCPYTEFHIAEPVRHLIVHQRFPGRLELSFHHRFIGLRHGHLIILSGY